MIKERVTVFGRKSWLGGLIAQTLGAYQSDVDITDRYAVRRVLKDQGTEVAVNVAAKTGGENVDGCDLSLATQAETYRVNALGPMYLLDECRRTNARLVHLSTTYVLMETPPVEDGFTEATWPVLPGRKSYAGSKAASDLVLQMYESALVLRINLPIDGKPHPRNFITKLAGYPSVQDVRHTLTTVPMLTTVMGQLISRRAKGMYHVVHPDVVSNGQLVTWYREIVDPTHDVPITQPDERTRPGIIARPERLANECILVGRAEPAIKECLHRYMLAFRAQTKVTA